MILSIFNSDMARFIVKVVLFGLCVVLLTLSLCVAMLSVPNKDCKYSHEMNVSLSIERLEAAEGKKIVFFGGSGLGFGLNSQKVQETVGMPVYNTGTHGGLGLLLELALFKPYIGEGDIVVCVPEYQQYLGNYMYGDEAALRILSSLCPQGYRYVTIRQCLYLLRYVPDAFGSALSARDAVPYGGPYSALALNEFGDVECYEFRDSTEVKYVDCLEAPLQPRSVMLLREFDDFCKRKGAMMLLLPPAYRNESFQANRSRIDAIWDMVIGSGLPAASSPTAYCLPDTLFFDSNYHLTKQGVEFRTDKVVSDICDFVSSSVQ